MTANAHPFRLVVTGLVLALFSLALSLYGASRTLSPDLWMQAAIAPDLHSIPQLTLHYSVLPRIVTAILIGAGLTLAGVLMQLTLRNPAAEPATLGVSAGAFLAMSAASLWAPSFVHSSRTAVALAGGIAASLLVFGLAWRSRFAAQVLLLAGLMTSLYAGGINTLLIMLHGGLIKLFIWGSGSLATQDWDTVLYLLPRLIPACLASLLLIRPIAVLTVSDEAATSLGASPAMIRLGGLALAVWIAAVCVAGVGVIGFIGLAAPEIVRRCGYRRVHEQLLAAPIFGALLLWATDQLFQILPTASEIPAGAATAFLGAPLLLWLIARRKDMAPIVKAEIEAASHRLRAQGPMLALIIATALVAAGFSLLIGRGLHGWTFTGLSSPEATLFWRGPRMVSAAAAAALISIAGCIVQRLTSNPLASPELLGISSGAACGVVIALFIPGAGPAISIVLSMAGAATVLSLLLLFGHRKAFAPHDLFMFGVALTTCFSAVVSVLLASGNPRMFDLLRWLNGSTFLARPIDALILTISAILALALLPLFARWLALLPLGSTTQTALGMPVSRSRGLLLAFACMLVGLSVLMIGPLSFIGLMAPHMARMAGFRRPLMEMSAATAIGATLMILADWLGRILLFPNQLPAGLIATLIAAPYLFLLMAKRR
ncbi:Fe3+-hydroxamate ABC transporter permease FhuB [Rhizobium sp. AC27/96]|uniref:Fe(3+)-hydroxamate ABC transporter permease FhuB n=1 Tax=Rhizobium sp. AC27/96 TaxID=1841653 RepID=UPI000827DC4B|nr:Fe(3+)-hydroxamate ABC transporter permease FhuB [Rhizobium sp. AC27/96]OCJ09426.1 Fe3+-hydroxamate ABC transporter permease FhuB [Rhizobium sp. AC27/96]